MLASQHPRVHRINLSTSAPSDTKTFVPTTATTLARVIAVFAPARALFRGPHASILGGSKPLSRRILQSSLAAGQLLCNHPPLHHDVKRRGQLGWHEGEEKFQGARVYYLSARSRKDSQLALGTTCAALVPQQRVSAAKNHVLHRMLISPNGQIHIICSELLGVDAVQPGI